MDSPFLDTAQACVYLGHGRAWLRKHRADIGYFPDPDGRIYYHVEDLDRWRMKRRVAPPAEIGPVRRIPRRAGSSAGGLNRVTGDPYGTPYLVATSAPPATDSHQRKARRV